MVDTLDTSGFPHTSDYLQEIASTSIKKVKEKFGCKAGSFVTDNAANMVKMRKALMEDEDGAIISYGCSAHYLNLLAKDVNIPSIKEHVVAIVKYFRNTHLPKAWFSKEGGKGLSLPIDVRWNSVADCLESYLKNWAIMLKVSEDHRSEFDKDIFSKLSNLGIKRSAEDLLARMKPISVALDKVQADKSTIADAVNVWKDLEVSLEQSGQNVMKQFKARKAEALTAAHYLANILHPGYGGQKLTDEEVDSGLEFCGDFFENNMAMLLAYRARADPFKAFMFKNNLASDVSPLTWWKNQSGKISESFQQMVHQLLTAAATGAPVERIFSTFGLVHSKLRN